MKCDHCSKEFCDQAIYQRHIRSLRDITDDTIRDLKQRIYPETGYEDEDGYQEVIEKKINEIRNRTKGHKHYQVINEQIDPNFNYNDINRFLLDYYTNHTNGFKVNLGFGYVLYHTISEIYKYHYVSTNNLLFEKAVVITCRKDISDLMNHIISLDLATNYYLKKPSSGWVLAGLTNITYIITQMKEVPLGTVIELPSYIKNSKSMYSLTKNYRGKPYKDNDCFFRCLSLHQGALISGLEKLTKKLKTEFEEHIGEKLDNGITLDHIPAVEIKYQVAINILSLKEDGNADVVYLSRLDFKPMYINLYEKHCSYIHNYEKFANRFRCSECDRTFNQSTFSINQATFSVCSQT